MANKTQAALFLALAIVCLGSCTQNHLSPEAYFSYVEEHKADLLERRDLDVLTFEANYIPTDMMAARDLNVGKGPFDHSQFAAAYKNYENAWYFSFKIKPSDSGNSLKSIIRTKENYSVIKQYLADAIRSDFSVEVDSEKISCSLINVEPDLTMQDCFLFIMSFEKPVAKALPDNGITLVYHDNMFQNGILKFNFSKDQVTRFPKIKVS